MKGADRLIHAGVNGWDPSRLLPFLSCFAEPGAEITVTATHAFYGYAEVVVASQKCAGVVHLEAIDTDAALAAAKEARDADAKERVRICEDWSKALDAEAKEILAQDVHGEEGVRAALKLMHTAQADIRLAASRCLQFVNDIAKVDASAKKVEAACESRGFQWCRGDDRDKIVGGR
jgi:plasmid stability protein